MTANRASGEGETKALAIRPHSPQVRTPAGVTALLRTFQRDIEEVAMPRILSHVGLRPLLFVLLLLAAAEAAGGESE